MVETKTALRPLVIEQDGPIPGSRALATIPAAPVHRIETVPASAANEFADDWALEDFLRAAGIAILDYEAACRTMDRLAHAAQAAWGWHPLRQQDCRTFADWQHANGPRLYDQSRDGHFASGYLAGKLYPHAVPQLAWELAFWLERGFGRPVTFYVSHYDARRPDPFLAATVNGKELYVVAEWKQPGRREPLKPFPDRGFLRPLGLPLWAWFALATALIAWGLHK